MDLTNDDWEEKGELSYELSYAPSAVEESNLDRLVAHIRSCWEECPDEGLKWVLPKNGTAAGLQKCVQRVSKAQEKVWTAYQNGMEYENIYLLADRYVQALIHTERYSERMTDRELSQWSRTYQ